jgi:hypothetical protein
LRINEYDFITFFLKILLDMVASPLGEHLLFEMDCLCAAARRAMAVLVRRSPREGPRASVGVIICSPFVPFVNFVVSGPGRSLYYAKITQFGFPSASLREPK